MRNPGSQQVTRRRIMKTFIKYAAAATLAGALAVGMATPSQARHGRNAAAIGGFAAGAFVGAAAASAANNSYYYGGGPGYYYEPGPYAYEPAPVYEAAPVYAAPRYEYRRGGCWHSTDDSKGYGYYGAC
jgi:hypothetical protein